MLTVKELIQQLEKLPQDLYVLSSEFYSVDNPSVECGLNWWFMTHGETDEQCSQDKAVML